MSFFRGLIIRFYELILIFLGLGIIIFALNPLDMFHPQGISDSLVYIQTNLNSKIIAVLSGLFLILVSHFLAQLILGTFQREKTIAFTTASGPVIIALTAIEDLIKRVTNVFYEIKELRPDVKKTKKGIEVDLRVILKSEVSIPDLTERLQEITRSKIQEVLGLEEQIIIRIQIVKIISSQDTEKKGKEPEKEEPGVPFGSYGRA